MELAEFHLPFQVLCVYDEASRRDPIFCPDHPLRSEVIEGEVRLADGTRRSAVIHPQQLETSKQSYSELLEISSAARNPLNEVLKM